ncbi:MAG: hypothetical protein HOM96_00395 [Rickettsiales bacterium]|nr:hypothetical protein [Rickettsiales bacterium]
MIKILEDNSRKKTEIILIKQEVLQTSSHVPKISCSYKDSVARANSTWSQSLMDQYCKNKSESNKNK